MRTEAGRVARVLLVLVLGLAAAAGVGVLLYTGVGPFPDPEGCTAQVGEVTVELDTDQAENAATIAAIGVRRGLPARAVSIALATAYQESKIRNLDHGDRDSVGIFQQRPSQGWGTSRQIQDPVYATNQFYDELEKIDGFETMRITEAAQRVQRSGFPEAYEDHAADGRALASALTGWSPAAFSCVVREDDARRQREGASGLTPRAAKVRQDVERVFGDLSLGGFAAGGVSTGHMKGSAHYDGRAIDIFFRPVSDQSKRRGWAVAQYLVAHADRLKVDHVIFDAKIWSAGPRSSQGWRDYDPGDRPGNRATLLHRDHVHVDVVEGG
ncbi:hypothetical protein [Nocardioides mesophilus]|uniref:ARB-07466-like C-terminal domain-containing protein n=1 Tax=Nocardioides mesophilus TaxID=433659 RepID=A0A7G9R7Z4_9ACTN|nr:hypothetical protein [Nocardioides mesophilus]QNN51719.1 hypothetical protein H9L09_14265 [Nocardioides mesophilus]